MRAELALKLETYLRPAAKDRMLTGVKVYPQQNSGEGRIDRELAKVAGVGHDTVIEEEKRLARERQLANLKRGKDAPVPGISRNGDLGESREKAAKAKAQPRGEDGTFGTVGPSVDGQADRSHHVVAARVLAEEEGS